jgi:tubulin polyglutamylase TTLL6/13
LFILFMSEYKHLLKELAELPRRPPPLAKIDLTRTEYPVIRVTAGRLGWKIFNKRVDRKEEVTLFWRDDYADREEIKRLLPYQRINHFPDS